MRLFAVLFSILTGLLLLSTLICGLWIRAQKDPVDPSSVQFHTTIAIASVVCCTIILIAFALTFAKTA
jgi:hypothetical protein